MARRVDTLNGALSNLGDAWDAFAVAIFDSGAGD